LASGGVWTNGPIIAFLTLFLVLPLALGIWIRIMRRAGRWRTTKSASRGFEVKLNTADTAKSPVNETRD
jgi:hypothetical protein